MNPSIAIVLGMVAALTCTILSLILITPEKKRGQLNPFFRFVHDLFNFKFLVIESILKFFYILVTLSCIGIGFFLLFSGYGYRSYYRSMAGYGLLLMIGGPIVFRIAYETVMLAIIAVKNIIQINGKLKGEASGSDPFVSGDQIADAAKAAKTAFTAEAPAQEENREE